LRAPISWHAVARWARSYVDLSFIYRETVRFLLFSSKFCRGQATWR
jgi:hypothetical protein